MFDRFGEFDSAQEINEAAAEKLKEGDTEAVIAIAEENGIDKEDAEDYIDGCSEKLATPLMAAVGKLKMEGGELEINGILKDWKDAVAEACIEDEAFCMAVRKKGKSLKCCMAELIRFAFENKVKISDKIVDATKVMHNGRLEKMRKPLYLGVPNRAEAKRIIREYYMK